MMLPFAGKTVNEKVSRIRAGHQKEYVPYYRNAVIAIYLFVSLIATGAWFGAEGEWWGLPVASLGLFLFSWMPWWIFKLGNEDDRGYFLKCIAAAEDEYELAEMGFDKYDEVEGMIFSRLINGDFENAAWDKNIRKLHNKFDLRKLADEAESYDRSIS